MIFDLGLSRKPLLEQMRVEEDELISVYEHMIDYVHNLDLAELLSMKEYENIMKRINKALNKIIKEKHR